MLSSCSLFPVVWLVYPDRVRTQDGEARDNVDDVDDDGRASGDGGGDGGDRGDLFSVSELVVLCGLFVLLGVVVAERELRQSTRRRRQQQQEQREW